ncbi:MAG: PAS domain S-box protein [Rubrobacter sp.]|nr:PAS domain S-box protein [Rubrobacter sp.]
MSVPLRILMVEDSEDEAVLLLRQLRRGGYAPVSRRVDTAEAMESAFDEEEWDIVTADHYMPFFSATEALALLHRRGLDLPFIVVSGRIGEDVAVEMMKAGAHDYIMKDHLALLGPAVERAVREAAVRRERRRDREELRRSEERYRRVVEQAADALFVHDLEGRFVDVNRQACESLGYTRGELLGMSVTDVEVGITPESLAEMWGGMDLETPLTIEGTNRRKDGTTFPVEVRLGPFEAEERRLVLASVRDVTERKRSEEALRDSEERYRVVAETASDAIIVIDEGGRISFVNGAAESTFGYSGEEMVGEPLTMLMPEYLRGAHRDSLERYVSTGERHLDWRSIRLPGLHESGREVPLEMSFGEFFKDGERLFTGFIRDVTERERSEKERDRLASYPLMNPNPIVETDVDGVPTYLNPAAEERFPELAAPGPVHSMLAGLESVAREIGASGGRPLVREVRVGESYYLQTISTVPGSDLLRVYATETTERHRAEAALRRSEERFRSLVQYGSDIVAILDAEGNITYESPAIKRVMGFDPEKRIGENVFDLIHPDDARELRDIFAEFLENPEAHPVVEYRTLDKGGSWRHFEAIGTNLLGDPAVGGIVVNSREITERKRAEEALRRSEDLYRTVVEQAAENIFIVDAETGSIVESNAATSASLGYTAEEIQRMTIYDLVAHDRASIEANTRRIVSEGYHSIGERQYRRKDGSLADVEVSASAISYAGREAMCVVAHEVTERKRAEEDLVRVREAERSRIAQEMHDDALQDLVYALQEAQVLRECSEDEDTALTEIIDALRRSVEGMRAAIFELRLEEILKEPFASSLKPLLELHRRMSRSTQEVEVKMEDGFPEEISPVAARKLLRIVQEALNNARRHSGARYVRVTLSCEGEEAFVEVADDGRGFDPESSGGGMGSSAMRRRALEVGGQVEVESAPGRGTWVRFRAPVTRLTGDHP